MSHEDDDAIDSDMEILEDDEDEQTDDELSEMTNMIKQFAAECLNKTETSNKNETEDITAKQEVFSKQREEKVNLLYFANEPLFVNIATALKLTDMHKQQLDKFFNLFKAENECEQAYAKYCDEAIKAVEANGPKGNFDEYTDMSHNELVNRISEMKIQTESIKKATEELKVNYKKSLHEHQEELNSILNETSPLEKIEREEM